MQRAILPNKKATQWKNIVFTNTFENKSTDTPEMNKKTSEKNEKKTLTGFLISSTCTSNTFTHKQSQFQSGLVLH